MVYQFQLWIIANNKTYNLGQNFTNLLVMITNAGYAQDCYLPQILSINFSYGNIVLMTKATNNRFYYLSLTLKRLIFRKVKFYLQDTNVHWSQ